MRRSCLIPLIALILTASASPAFAWKQYAIALGKPCVYCHAVKPDNQEAVTGLNPRGQYFLTHKHTFDGYDETRVMGRFSPPLFHPAWRETLPATARRIAVADTVGDGKARLIVLSDGAAAESRTISVRKWDGQTWATEFTADVPGGGDKLAVGAFAANHPAVIVTVGALWYWDGKTYQMKPAAKPVQILGTVTMKDGARRLLVREGESARLYGVDPNASGDWLVDPVAPPSSAATDFSEMKGTTKELQAVGMPDLLAAGGIVGLWDARKSGALFLYGVQITAIVDSRDPGQTSARDAAANLVLKGQEQRLAVVDPRAQTAKPLWTSEKLPGAVLDVALGDPRSSARGLTVLTDAAPGAAPGANGKGHALIFFQLD